MADGATMAAGRAGYVIADAVRIDNATNPVGPGNSPPLASKSDEMPALPKPTEMPDLPPQMSAVGLPDGAWRYGSTGQLFEAKNGQWIRCLPGAPESTKPLKPPPEPLDAWEIAIAAAFVILLGQGTQPPSAPAEGLPAIFAERAARRHQIPAPQPTTEVRYERLCDRFPD
jgi:hypothetical protein